MRRDVYIENDSGEIIGDGVVIGALPAVMMFSGFLPSVARGAAAMASGV